MNQVSKAYDGEGLEWLYTHSRNYPLLSAEEERDIDERKWQTRDVLLEALLTDVRSRFSSNSGLATSWRTHPVLMCSQKRSIITFYAVSSLIY